MNETSLKKSLSKLKFGGLRYFDSIGSTNDEALATMIAKLKDHGRMSKYEHDELGYGERLDGLQAAILGAKLPHLESWNAARRQHAAYYTQALAGVAGVQTPQVMADS